MRAHVLVDLFVPARLGSPRELQFVAAKAGLDAIVRVADDPDELPTNEELSELDPDGPAVLTATSVVGPGFRFACLLPLDRATSLESLEATGDARLIQATVNELGGLALPVTPRQGPTGSVSRQAPVLGGQRAGVVALTIPGSHLGRDLDLEDTVIAERPILGGSGPFATLDEVGRYASLVAVAVRAVPGSDEVPAMRPNQVAIGALASALASGRGFAVELAVKRPQLWLPDPSEGREEGDDPRGNRRRRRRRGPKPNA